MQETETKSQPETSPEEGQGRATRQKGEERFRMRLPMKLVDRYILRQFLMGSLVAMVSFIIIYIAVDLMEKLDKFLDHKMSFKLVAEYYINFLPQIIALILPVCLLLGSLFATARMSTQNEIIAMRSAGISLYRLMMPFVVAATLISAGSVYFDGWILPKANMRVEEILRDYVHEDLINNSQFDMFLQESPTRIVSMSDYSLDKKQANKISIQDFDPKNITKMIRRIDATSMTWDSAHTQWRLQNATERSFPSDTSSERIRPLTPQESNVRFTFYPAEIKEHLMKMDELTNTELMVRIDQKRNSGQDVAKDLVDYHSKYSLAFSSLMVVLFGVPFASKKKRGGLSFEFSIAIGIAFAYLTFSKISQTFGYSGLASPVLTAWLANILFFAGSVIVIWKTQK